MYLTTLQHVMGSISLGHSSQFPLNIGGAAYLTRDLQLLFTTAFTALQIFSIGFSIGLWGPSRNNSNPISSKLDPARNARVHYRRPTLNLKDNTFLYHFGTQSANRRRKARLRGRWVLGVGYSYHCPRSLSRPSYGPPTEQIKIGLIHINYMFSWKLIQI